MPIRELRDLTRYRAALIGEHTRETNRLQKVLDDAGIKLASVASDVLGVSGRAVLDALTQGTRDPDVLADLARGALRRKLPALRQALVIVPTSSAPPIGYGFFGGNGGIGTPWGMWIE